MPVLENASLLTATDYRRLSPEFGMGPRYQLVEGTLRVMAAPNRFHQEISGNLYASIKVHLRQYPVGAIYASPFDVYLDEYNVLQPDLVYISRERAGVVLVPEGARGAPDLLIEILSPSTAVLDRRQKRRVYAQVGAAELWLIDPEQRAVEVFLLSRDAEQPAAVHALTVGTAAPALETAFLPGWQISLSEIFAAQLAS